MLFFLLPILFNPFGIIVSWLPALYLASWPIIIQTLGRETIVTHTMVLILFILTCDASRRFMLKLIGFDLISLPLGIALLLFFATDNGNYFLSLIRPLFSGTLTLIEPVFLIIEAYLFIDMINSFNRWITKCSHVREEDSSLSHWEPPLATSSIVARVVVIVITILSYIGVYLLIQESKLLLNLSVSGGMVPVIFNHAIAALVTLQLIAVSATIYKEEGILSESAMIALLATLPIFLASWSYYNLNQTTSIGLRPATTTTPGLAANSWWPSSLGFSIFWPEASGSQQGEAHFDGPSESAKKFGLNFFSDDEREFQHKDKLYGPTTGGSPSAGFLSASSIERSVDEIETLDFVSRSLLKSFLKNLIMIINSILGLSGQKLANYYFGAEFWLLLGSRFVCLSWLALIYLGRTAGPSAQAAARRVFGGGHSASAKTAIKILLVLAYAQMLIQQMENRTQLGADSGQSGWLVAGPGAEADSESALNRLSRAYDDIGSWFECVWSSARACSGFRLEADKREPVFRRAWNYLGQVLALMFNKLASVHLIFSYLTVGWFARWRSPIVQRLVQSILIQAYYITRMVISSDEHLEDNYF